MRRHLLVMVAFLTTITLTHAQSFSINTDGSIADTSAILDVKSTTKGFLLPRMNKAQRNLIFQPATGLLIYQSAPDSIGFHYYDGTKWVWLSGAGGDTLAWQINGNANTTTSHFIGTTNDSNLYFRIRNTPSGYIDSAQQNTGLGYRSASNITSGIGNSAFGYRALDSNTTGYANTAVGRYSLTSLKTGFANTAVGNAAMYEAGGVGNNFFNNTAVGVNALLKGRYDGNTAIGAMTLTNDTGGRYNTAVGCATLYNNNAGIYNTAIGTMALTDNRLGNYNTAVGVFASRLAKNGSGNTAVGYAALYEDTAATGGNTAVGLYGLVNLKSASGNTALGVYAGQTLRSGTGNTFLGAFSNASQPWPDGEGTGDYNTAAGAYSLYQNKTGSYTTAIGYQAGYNNDTSLNTFVGANSGFSNTKGIKNTYLGEQAGYFNVTGHYNVFVGEDAGLTATGDANVYIGQGTGSYAKVGSENTMVGRLGANNGAGVNFNMLRNSTLGAYAGWGFVSSANNTYLGHSAGAADTSGISNVAVGYYSLSALRNGQFNSAVGASALSAAISSFNAALGFQAGNAVTTGTQNTLLGFNSDVSTGTLSNATAVGANAQVGASNSLVLGSINGVNGSTADTKVGIGTISPDSLFSVADSFMVNRKGEITFRNGVSNLMYMFQSPTTNNIMVLAHSPAFKNYGLQYQDNGDKFNFLGAGNNVMTIELASGRIGIGTNVPAYQLELSLNSAAKPGSTMWTVPSDERLKTIEGSYNRGLQDILKLNTIKYHYTKDNPLKLPSTEEFYGFSAQEVQKIFPEAVKVGKDGFLSLDIHPILLSYINAFKEQQQTIEKQQQLLDRLTERLEKLEKALNR